MTKVKSVKRFGIYKLNSREEKEYGFSYAPVHPDNMGCSGLTPDDADMPCDTLEAAIEWAENYDMEEYERMQ